MVFMVQNMVMMQGISHFFLGFVLVKFLFPLTNGFKQMFQRGLDLSTLETSYVSNVSWYFLVMFGLRAFFCLAIGDPSPETLERKIKQRDLGMAESPTHVGPQQFVAPKALIARAGNLELLQQRPVVDEAEKWLLGKRYPKGSVLGKGRTQVMIYLDMYTGVGRTDVSTRRNVSAAMGDGTGAQPLALEGRRAMGSGGWHQLCRGCKDAEYLCRRGKIIQIECTQIGTNT